MDIKSELRSGLAMTTLFPSPVLESAVWWPSWFCAVLYIHSMEGVRLRALTIKVVIIGSELNTSQHISFSFTICSVWSPGASKCISEGFTQVVLNTLKQYRSLYHEPLVRCRSIELPTYWYVSLMGEMPLWDYDGKTTLHWIVSLLNDQSVRHLL